MNISSHKDKKWSSWEYDNSNERYYRYRITRNGDYEYDWQPAPAASTAGETRDNPEIATNVEQITQGLSQFNVGDEYSAYEQEEDPSYTTEPAQTRDQVPSSGYAANWHQEVSNQSDHEELAYDDYPSPQGPAYPETGQVQDAHGRYDRTEDDQESQGGQPTASYAKPVPSMDQYHSSSKHSKGKGKESRDETQFPPQRDDQQYHQQYDDEHLYEADDSNFGQPLATPTAYPYTQYEHPATGFSYGTWTTEPVDDLAEDEDEDLQAAKRESRSIFQHPQAGDESGPSSASAYHYAQTQDLSAVYEDGSSSGSTHVYSNAQDPYGNEAAGRTTPRPGEYSVVYTIQNVLQDENQLDSRYCVQPTSRFQPGEIFIVHWPQPLGAEAKDSATDERTYVDKYGGLFHFGFRRFVVVANDQGHSQCVPILTYRGKACTKKGVKPLKHGIIYQHGRKPKLLPGEPTLGFPPVRVQMTEEGETLCKESRVNYSKIHTVEHNIRVLFIGRIATEAGWEMFSDAVNACWEQMTRFKKRRK